MAVKLATPDRLIPVAGVRLAAAAAGVRKPDRDDVVLLELAPGKVPASEVELLFAGGIHDAQVIHVQHGFAGGGGRFLDPQQDLAAHHQLGQLRGAGLGGLDGRRHLAPPHDADGIGDIHDLAQLVGDQDDRLALVPQVAQDAEQVIRLGRGQNAGRFVQDQDIRLPIQRLEDLDTLLHADTDILDHRIGIDVQFIFRGQRFQRGARLGQTGAQQAAILGPKDDVLQHREILDQLEMLEHHADACGDGRLAVGDGGLLPTDEDLARIGLVEPIEDRHQRGFARAILADDAMDRAGHDADRNVLVGLHGPKRLGDAAQLDRGHLWIRRGSDLPRRVWCVCRHP